MQISSVLEGSRVLLIPMNLSHAEALFDCGKDTAIWTFLPNKIETIADMIQLIEKSLESKEMGLEFPFVVFDKELNKLVGSTRFLNISLPNKNLEIGWTWYSPEVWRTSVNTECKYQLLTYCFEELKTVRVQFRADIRNERSNKALERIGATKEGILRQDRILHDGYIRNSYIYSIIDSEWPHIKNKLEGFLGIGTHHT
ncbi:GNAT family N-acetyltransferase [Paenibacillus eucommiae]|uniref:RimJ/RimL family protein N-acetyltransferase n=1 Tax=Paenibacillus eucommiae TaxID=1355755 RepID=A0ABS4IQF8_9BACL|nr:GNAT family protein [Paenibacillus eucommiae]MBP1989809.1 RimJ/RimL family protein N-acetyltransferase [Paenibacillus eucommiae]